MHNQKDCCLESRVLNAMNKNGIDPNPNHFFVLDGQVHEAPCNNTRAFSYLGYDGVFENENEPWALIYYASKGTPVFVFASHAHLLAW